ncbi:MAG: ABC transporter substrate-binding protein [Nitrospira sp.]
MNQEQINQKIKKWRVPYSDKLIKIIDAFSLTEKVLFFSFVTIFALSGVTLLYQLNKAFMVEVPDYGGTLTEGVIGSPRFINPILASSDTDKDLSSLVYSGLLKENRDGELVTDLAESYFISGDNLTYTFVLKDKIYFHDGTKITADDIVFTIEKAQDPDLKSPRKANWDGVKVERIDERRVSFTLKQPYSPFIQNMTLGILPKHIWKSASIEEFPFSQYNTKPVGSGEYKVDNISYTGSGLPSQYTLKAYNKYALGEPYITNLIIKTYQNEKDLTDAYKKGDVESLHSISPKQLPELKIKDDQIILSPLPRIFGVFFNQNVAPSLVYKEVRQALDMATDKQAIIDNVIGGMGQIIDSPVPKETVLENKSVKTSRLEEAKALLSKNGWKANADGVLQKKDKKSTATLAFSISTGDAPELKEAAMLLKKQWEALGARVDVKIFEIGDLNQNIIRPRKYDALLFGEVVGKDLDLYPFWHSSQRNTPGLNIAMYTNIKVDRILENIRKTTDKDEQKKYIENFDKEIKNDTPAVFTYSPYFIYIVPKKVHNVNLGVLTTPGERFNDVKDWYIETNNVWKIFKGKN